MGEFAWRSAPAIVRPMQDLAFIEIDEMWLAENPEGWQSRLGSRLPFLFMDLEEGIQESAAVNYADIEVVGRAEAYKSYVGTGNREIQLTFQFRVQGIEAGAFLETAIDNEVLQPAHWLEALKYPYVGDDELSHAPPPCLLQVGQLFSGRVVATDVQRTWQSPFEPESLLPHGAEVTCTFAVTSEFIDDFNFENEWT